MLQPGPTAADGLPAPLLRYAMAVIVLGIGLSVLDSTLINIALPSIAADLGTTPSKAVMVVNAYQIAIISLLLPLATLGDRVGYRRIYRVGLVIFVAASVLCVLADSIEMLVAARALQGTGAAALSSISAALVRIIYPKRLLARGIAISAMTVACASAAGPTLAAAILHLGPWQWLFLLNVPFGLLALFGALRYLPASPRATAAFDLPSALLSMAAFGLVFVGIDLIGHRQFTPTTAIIIVAGLVIATIFVRRQLRVPLPLLPVDLLRIPIFALSIGTSFCSFAAQMISFVSLPFLLQNTLGHSPVETGLLLTPWPLAVMVTAPLAARLLDRIPAGLMGGIGLMVFAAGLLAIALLPGTPAAFDVVWRVALCGVGFGFFQAPNNHAILTAAPAHRSGGASGMIGTARLSGQTVGATIAALGFALLGGPSPVVMLVAALIALIGAGVSLLRIRAARTPLGK